MTPTAKLNQVVEIKRIPGATMLSLADHEGPENAPVKGLRGKVTAMISLC
jgi:hypothetical protein